MIKAVFDELEENEVAEEYTEAEVLKLLKMLTKMRADVVFKANMMWDRYHWKAVRLRKFRQDAQHSLQMFADMLANISSHPVMVAALQTLKKHKRYDLTCMSGLAKVQRRSSCRARVMEEEPIRIEAECDPMLPLRCKSCCGQCCGGKAYYEHVQKRLQVLPANVFTTETSSPRSP